MLVRHRGAAPVVHATAYVAPSAVLSGAVTVGARSRVLHGAVLTAEGGDVRVGPDSVVMENALVRGRHGHPAIVGSAVLVGPHAHVNGAVVEDEAFLATGAALFPGAVVEVACEVRVHGVVHVNSRLARGTTVPIGWVAAGDPAELFSPDRHDDLWRVQRELDFPGTADGAARGTRMRELMSHQVAFYGEHLADEVLEDD